ncbi:TonB family protein [Fusobacterium sp. PH5-44]|uniref:TonB family protein n=1 Tax=unclassified Fusobacterium TaxID=2648384 RepID=UPI003D1E5155
MKYIIISLIIHLGIVSGMYFDLFDNEIELTPKKIAVDVAFNVIEKQETVIMKTNELSDTLELPAPPSLPVEEVKVEPASEAPPPDPLPIKKSKEKKIVKKDTKSKEQPKKKEKSKNTSENSNNIQNKVVTDVFGDSKQFKSNGDGTYTAFSTKGINYQILMKPEPSYPARAQRANFNRSVTVRAKFLVDLNGNVGDVQILSGNAGMGFDDEVRRVLKSWKFKPIIHNGKKIKLYFNRNFTFHPKR